jgi:hypothetical protein
MIFEGLFEALAAQLTPFDFGAIGSRLLNGGKRCGFDLLRGFAGRDLGDQAGDQSRTVVASAEPMPIAQTTAQAAPAFSAPAKLKPEKIEAAKLAGARVELAKVETVCTGKVSYRGFLAERTARTRGTADPDRRLRERGRSKTAFAHGATKGARCACDGPPAHRTRSKG